MPIAANKQVAKRLPGQGSSNVRQKNVSPPFPIVGIGASAGGLEALTQFLAGVPAQSGMAFVIVQHLDPDRKGMLCELLQRATSMPVCQAVDRMLIKANCVYVIPPNQELTIQHGRLHLQPPQAPHGLRLPIDRLFISLAEERRDKAIGVVLSGMGSDGTEGLRAIAQQGGLTLAQPLASAGFDAMPNSVIEAGLVDIIALPQDMSRRILDALAGPPGTNDAEPPEHQSAFATICRLLRSHTRHDFSLYKKNTVYRRIERRMGVHHLASIADYARFLEDNPQEVELLFKELLIGVTSFFRDPAIWEQLQQKIIPEIIRQSKQGDIVRAWVAGCSTGEEAYSLAIVFKEALATCQPRTEISLQIFATDLDPDAIAKARQGLFPASIGEQVSAERLARFFRVEGPNYRIAQDIREMLVFAPQNVTMDPPFTKLDILTCRNLLIYLGPALQKRLLPLFHFSLKPGGVMFLGSAESIAGFEEFFTPIDSKSRLYRREQAPMSTLNVDFPTSQNLTTPTTPTGTPSLPMQTTSLQTFADQLLLQKFSPAAVLTNADGDILFINGRTGKYLEPAAGKANWNIHAMAREGLRQELLIALPQALRTGEAVNVSNLTVGSGDAVQQIDLTVEPVSQPAAFKGMVLVVFREVTRAAATLAPVTGKTGTNARIVELEHALHLATTEIQSIRDKMLFSHEELRASNEELQSTNEELQSTNEELTTSKEEMQSLNEELQTVNVELQSKVDELSATNNDMNNLLNSTDIATVFLDGQLRVRRFTKQATKIFKLIPADAGRPLTDIVNELNYPELGHDAEEVLRRLVFSEKEVAGLDGRWYIVRIMPYRTLENVIDGVVITLIDISQAKQLEAELRASRSTAVEGKKESE